MAKFKKTAADSGYRIIHWYKPIKKTAEKQGFNGFMKDTIYPSNI